MSKTAEAAKITITESPSNRAKAEYLLTADGGSLHAIFYSSGNYHINQIDVAVEKRGQGIGKMLLEQSITHARALQAVSMGSHIVSRECYDAMRTVFGEEHVVADYVGDYRKLDPTNPDPTLRETLPKNATSADMFMSLAQQGEM